VGAKPTNSRLSRQEWSMEESLARSTIDHSRCKSPIWAWARGPLLPEFGAALESHVPAAPPPSCTTSAVLSETLSRLSRPHSSGLSSPEIPNRTEPALSSQPTRQSTVDLCPEPNDLSIYPCRRKSRSLRPAVLSGRFRAALLHSSGSSAGQRMTVQRRY
jgi:hypothetical protein